MKIRTFIETDRGALREVYLESRRRSFEWADCDQYSLDDFDRETEGEMIWVVHEDDRPVAFISVWQPKHFVHNLFVHPDFIGKGAGSMLLKECLQNIGRPVRLKCCMENIKAQGFYQARGFSIVGEGTSRLGDYVLMEFAETLESVCGNEHGSKHCEGKPDALAASEILAQEDACQQDDEDS
ncbi:MAG: GNAT family N-acetyltransferase [Verrucomicrobia bacterium]|nr:GNAT family N-acetyltransferase [Verrucomicrobiota bacterium]